MKKIPHLLTSLLIIFGIAGVVSVATPQAASAACDDRLLTFPAWYKGLVDEDSCEIIPPTQAEGSLSKFIWKIALNVVEMLMQLVGYASVIFLIIGGFRYITATGDANRMSAAKTTITNAIIGLAIALASVAIVNVIANAI